MTQMYVAWHKKCPLAFALSGRRSPYYTIEIVLFDMHEKKKMHPMKRHEFVRLAPADSGPCDATPLA